MNLEEALEKIKLVEKQRDGLEEIVNEQRANLDRFYAQSQGRFEEATRIVKAAESDYLRERARSERLIAAMSKAVAQTFGTGCTRHVEARETLIQAIEREAKLR